MNGPAGYPTAKVATQLGRRQGAMVVSGPFASNCALVTIGSAANDAAILHCIGQLNTATAMIINHSVMALLLGHHARVGS